MHIFKITPFRSLFFKVLFFGLLHFLTSANVLAQTFPADCSSNGGTYQCIKANLLFESQVGLGVYPTGDEACVVTRVSYLAALGEGVGPAKYWAQYPNRGTGCEFPYSGGVIFSQNVVLPVQSCGARFNLPPVSDLPLVFTFTDALDVDAAVGGRLWCVFAGPVNISRITLAGRTATRTLPAGPALQQTATVKQNGALAANKAVTIRSTSSVVLNGITDSTGEFHFTYVPPYFKTTDQITATCTDCVNTAQTAIKVEPCDVCEDKRGNPISTATGEKEQAEPDWQDSAAHPLSFTRHYRSYDNISSGLGSRWSHNWMATATKGELQATVRFGDGSKVLFLRNSATSPWTADNRKDALVDTSPGGPTTPSTYTRASDDSRWLFDGNGKLTTIIQRNGWATALAYNANTQLASVTNAFGRSLQFAYNASGQLVRVNTPDARQINYAFDSTSRLASAIYPDSKNRSYAYEDTRWPNALTGITDEAGVRYATFAYDFSGRATATQHVGNAQTYTVNYGGASTSAVGSLIGGSTVDPAIFRVTSQVTDPLGTLQTYTWVGGDGSVRLANASGPYEGGLIAARSFDTVPAMPASETDFLGTQTTFAWDTARRLLLTTTKAANQPQAQTSTTQWHPSLRLPVLMTEPGRTTATTYDTLGNKLSETITDTSSSPTAGQPRTWAWTYNPQGLVATSSDPRGNTSQYFYDAAGNLASFKNPLNQQTSYTYDGAGRVLSQTDPNGLLTSFNYDPRGRVLQTIRSNTGATAATEGTTYTHTPSSQLASAILPSGYAVAYTYDAAQRLTGATDNRNNRISYTLDAMGNRVREEVKDPGGAIAQLTTRTINTLNRVASTSGAANQTSQYGYDANGEPISSTDPLNQTTRQTLDPLRRPIATTFADNAAATQAWNPLDQLTQLTDPKGVATQYTRNAFGEVIQETNPDIGSISYTRDANGNITASTDAKGQTTQIARDALDRPSQVILADGKTQQLAYDPAGNLSQVTDAIGSTTYSRDALSRILQKTQTVADSATTPSAYSVSYQSHPGGQVAQITYPSGLRVFYRKNTSGQINQIDVQEPGGTASKPKPLIPFVAGLAYTALNQPKAWSWNCMAGTTAAPAPVPCGTASRSFDADGRMSANEFASYGYDSASRITSITQNLWASLDGINNFTTPITWSADYDSRNRLTSFYRSGSSTVNSTGNSTTTSYSYDPNSNRLSSIHKTTSDTDQDGDFDAVDFQKTTSQALAVAATSNKLTGFAQTLTTQRTNAGGNPVTSTVNSQVTYGLDQNGNLTSDGLRTFEYDAANRLSKVQVSQTAEAAKITYLHNALGQRVFKSEPQVAQTAPSQTELGVDFITWLKSNFGWLFAAGQANATLGQSYVYDDSNLGSTPNLLGEYGNGGIKSAGRIEYIWLTTEDGQSIPIGIYKGGRFLAVHSDHLGTPRLIVDDTSKPVWQWPYSAFGDNKPTEVLRATPNPKAAITNQPVLLKATAATEINLRFPGQYFDEESNLSFNYFRSYQPTQGRYTQNDPIGLSGGLNRFGYVRGNALSDVDPDGLNPAALARSFGVGQRVGEALNPTLQPVVANVLDKLFLPNPMDQTITLAQNNKQVRKRIDGLQSQIDLHRKKLDKDPNCDDSNHWRTEIAAWESEISRLRLRLPNGR